GRTRSSSPSGPLGDKGGASRLVREGVSCGCGYGPEAIVFDASLLHSFNAFACLRLACGSERYAARFVPLKLVASAGAGSTKAQSAGQGWLILAPHAIACRMKGHGQMNYPRLADTRSNFSSCAPLMVEPAARLRSRRHGRRSSPLASLGKLVLLAGAAILALLFVAGGAVDRAYQNRVVPGVRYAQISLGGLTEAEAKDLLDVQAS